jgi:hypothetical protein
MPKKSAASGRGSIGALATLLLGEKARVSALANVSLDRLLQRTREELSEAARRLGLSGPGRLAKEDLARRVREAVRRLAPAGPGDQPSSRPGKAGSAGGDKLARPRRQRRPATAPASRRVAAVRPRTAKKGGEPEPETGARSKFDLGSRVHEPRPIEHIPWGYGQNRITTLVTDPWRMYSYWEVRDDAIEAARRALGPGGRDAWLNLRVYDISGRIFDGMNAHSYFDVKVDRDTRQWFFEIGKPTSTHCVEIGLKSHEGYFVKIARSGRADFPRAEPGGPGPVEWLSVHEITGEIGAPTPGAPPAHAPAAAHPTPPTAPSHPPGAWAEGEYWVVSDTSAFREWALLSGWETHDFLATEWIGGHGRLEWFGTGQRFEWVGPTMHTTWEAGPFPMPIEVPGLVEERREGPVLVQKIGEKTRVIYGPWEVVIRGIGARAEGRVLARWEVRKSWVSDVGFEVVGGALRWRALARAKGAARPPGSSEGLLAGASERRWMAGSEVRLAGASEIFRVGASEFRYRGASETLFAGASEVRYRGASEVRYRGASERRLRGASERLVKGASERLFAGASERGGASERQYAGASEGRHRGASERRLGGASEKQTRSRYPTKIGASRKKKR